MYRVNSGEDGEIPEMTEGQSKEEENEGSEEEDEYIDTDNENGKGDSQLGEEEDEQNELTEGPDTEFSTFESCLIQILQSADKPLAESEIVKKATPYASLQGLYQSLNVEWRVRACLIFLKTSHEVFVDDTGDEDLWSLRPPIRHVSTVLFLEDDFQPLEPNQKSGINSNLDDLLKRCQAYHNRCFI